jgi:hypothetical protein
VAAVACLSLVTPELPSVRWIQSFHYTRWSSDDGNDPLLKTEAQIVNTKKNEISSTWNLPRVLQAEFERLWKNSMTDRLFATSKN